MARTKPASKRIVDPETGNLTLEWGVYLEGLEKKIATLEAASAQPASYTVATLPSASPAGRTIYVSDEAGGAVIAFSDGTAWRRLTDRAIVS